MGFLRDHFELVIFLIGVIAAIAVLVAFSRRSRGTGEDGFEVQGVITRIDVASDENGAGGVTPFVAFRDETGATREVPLADRGDKYTVGERVYVKYLPGHYEMVRVSRKG